MRLRCLPAALAAIVGLASAPGVLEAAPAAALAGACGSATQATVTSDYRALAWTIYAGELAGPEVRQDTDHVLASRALASGLADGDSAAVLAATQKLVYHSRWHIVRLRVLSRSGSVVADVGGPYVLAPVVGGISYRGRTVGSFVMSVQDDAGYTKLVARYSGLPIEIYAGGQPVEGEDFPPGSVPSRVPANGSTLSVAGVQYVAATYAVRDFPSGHDRALLAVPLASAALEASSCVKVNAAVYTSIAVHVARRVPLPDDVGVFIGVDRGFDPSKLVFVLSTSGLLASSDGAAAPPGLPLVGTVTYLGRRWLVESFVPVPGLRIYLLYPEGQGSGTTGPSGTSGSV